ncbi:MAG: DeoR/GlpR family DNA-binding transcription regulator [Spirochaetota bacterium]
MIPYVRRKMILAELENHDLLYIQDLLALLEGVSESTLRRDLRNLEEEGMIEQLQGGAAKINRNSSYDMPIESKQLLHIQEKENIARTAASFVKDGEVVYIDSGTNPLLTVKYLKHRKIQLITSNTYVLRELENASFTCHILGGEIAPNLGSVFGPVTDNQLRTMHFDRAFLGATGFSFRSGITTPDFNEANKKRIVMENSDAVYVLADHSKAGKEALCKVCSLDDCIIITDQMCDVLTGLDNYILANSSA